MKIKQILTTLEEERAQLEQRMSDVDAAIERVRALVPANDAAPQRNGTKRRKRRGVVAGTYSAQVFEHVKAAGKTGATGPEVDEAFGWEKGEGSVVLSNLFRARRITRRGKRGEYRYFPRGQAKES